mmetsp:Transcript_20671/g.33664  ORF Transcript_20671/g.33664 Transcript_20671/m.33664 type:complete len:91 (-) Transcript_20671:276-548(-)
MIAQVHGTNLQRCNDFQNLETNIHTSSKRSIQLKKKLFHVTHVLHSSQSSYSTVCSMSSDEKKTSHMCTNNPILAPNVPKRTLLIYRNDP